MCLGDPGCVRRAPSVARRALPARWRPRRRYRYFTRIGVRPRKGLTPAFRAFPRLTPPDVRSHHHSRRRPFDGRGVLRNRSVTIGVERSGRDEQYTLWGGDFSLASADNRNTVTRRLHIGFVAPSRVHVDAFWQAGGGAGYRSDGEPGPRPEYGPDYYGGFLLDPDGNSVEAV